MILFDIVFPQSRLPEPLSSALRNAVRRDRWRTRALYFSIALSWSATSAVAQIGDLLDKPGEVQKSFVPAERIPPAPALTPDEALKSFQLAPGFKLEIAACEPLVQDPVAIAFGTDGRLWVVEMRGYMTDLDGKDEDQPIGRVVVLRDRNSDGRYDDSTVFVANLVLPRAIMHVGDGVLVGAPPELAFWQDTDGDGKADRKVVVAADYGVKVDLKRPYLANPERAPNSLLWAHDNCVTEGSVAVERAIHGGGAGSLSRRRPKRPGTSPR